ncbi:MAG: hypothetical protein AAGH67_01610 [Cyanobacteria bacterium P01_H01_bin.162]
MTETYLTIARQGRNAWWRYLLSLILALGLTINASIFVAFPFLLIAALQERPMPTDDIWMSQPGWFFGVTAAVTTLMTLGLIVAIPALHQRPWRTVINPQGLIRWRRIVQGWGVWLGLMLLSIALFAVFDRDLYTVQVTSGWLWRWIPTLLVMPLLALMPSLVYGYLLQGLGLLISRPVRLTAVVAVLIGLFNVVSSPTPPTVWDWGFGLITVGFFVWIILQDRGLELLIGLQAANMLVTLQIVRSPDTTPTFPALLTRNAGGSSWLDFIVWLLGLGLFYAICFYAWPSSRALAPNSNTASSSQEELD